MADKAEQDMKLKGVDIPRFAYRVKEFGDAIGLTPPTLYKMRREGKLTMVKIAGRTLIPASEGERLLAEASF